MISCFRGIRCNDRLSAGHGFNLDNPETLVQTRENKEVACVHPERDLGVGSVACQHHVVREAFIDDLLFQCCSPRSVADDDAEQVRML
jgi:hypothetical protein